MGPRTVARAARAVQGRRAARLRGDHAHSREEASSTARASAGTRRRRRPARCRPAGWLALDDGHAAPSTSTRRGGDELAVVHRSRERTTFAPRETRRAASGATGSPPDLERALAGAAPGERRDRRSPRRVVEIVRARTGHRPSLGAVVVGERGASARSVTSGLPSFQPSSSRRRWRGGARPGRRRGAGDRDRRRPRARTSPRGRRRRARGGAP